MVVWLCFVSCFFGIFAYSRLDLFACVGLISCIWLPGFSCRDFACLNFTLCSVSVAVFESLNCPETSQPAIVWGGPHIWTPVFECFRETAICFLLVTVLFTFSQFHFHTFPTSLNIEHHCSYAARIIESRIDRSSRSGHRAGERSLSVCLIKTASLIVNARNAVTGLLPPRWSWIGIAAPNI